MTTGFVLAYLIGMAIFMCAFVKGYNAVPQEQRPIVRWFTPLYFLIWPVLIVVGAWMFIGKDRS